LKAKKIAIAAYQYAQMEIPIWLLEKQLEQNHLEESIIDTKEAVLNALKTMPIDQMKNLRSINELQNYKTAYLRFDHLVSNELLPFARKQTKRPIPNTDKCYNHKLRDPH
jgi:hypothetical protein